jgi:hypothetical protein
MKHETFFKNYRIRVIVKIRGLDEEHEAEVISVDLNGRPKSVLITDDLRWGIVGENDFQLICQLPSDNDDVLN